MSANLDQEWKEVDNKLSFLLGLGFNEPSLDSWIIVIYFPGRVWLHTVSTPLFPCNLSYFSTNILFSA